VVTRVWIARSSFAGIILTLPGNIRHTKELLRRRQALATLPTRTAARAVRLRLQVHHDLGVFGPVAYWQLSNTQNLPPRYLSIAFAWSPPQ
jgi:hypothetical protein